MSYSDAASSDPKTDPEMSSTDPDMDTDGEYFDCSLCGDDGDDDDYEQLLPLPGKESHTVDMEQFEFYLDKIKSRPRMDYDGDSLCNYRFWDYIRDVLDCAKPLGFWDLNDREQCLPMGPRDNAAMVTKIIQTVPINPIHPHLVSQMSGVPITTVLTELQHAVKVGMMTMRWTPICGRCASPTCAKGSLKTFPSTAYCQSCRYTTAVDMLQKIKVIFTFNSDIFYALAQTLACKPSAKALSITEFYAMMPATFSGSGFSWSAGCDGEKMVRPAIAPGKYRMRCPIALTDTWFVVEREALENDEPFDLPIHVSDLVYRGGELKTITVPHGKVRFNCFCDTNSFFILWILQDLDAKSLMYVPPDERSPMTDAVTIMGHPMYQKWFEGTDREADLFAGAVQRMMMTGAPVAGKAEL